MNGRIDQVFDRLKRNGRKAFVAYLTAGDPSIEKTQELALVLEASGVDILEIGVPFSDPTADGPVIQAASERALKNGATLENILEMIESLRKQSDIPVVLFGYYNPILAHGNERFAARASAAGVDGILVVDLPLEESSELRRHTDPYGLVFISLIAPTTGRERARNILGKAGGFVYYISVTGVTGTAAPHIENIRKDINAMKEMTTLPIMVGFGISTPRQAAKIAHLADGIVIGSAMVRLIQKHANDEKLTDIVSSFTAKIRQSIDSRIISQAKKWH